MDSCSTHNTHASIDNESHILQLIRPPLVVSGGLTTLLLGLYLFLHCRACACVSRLD